MEGHLMRGGSYYSIVVYTSGTLLSTATATATVL